MTCDHMTAKGTRCKSYPMAGTTACKQHTAPCHKPHQLTPALMADIVKTLASGCSVKDAATFNKIGVSTFYRWMETGEADAQADVASKERDLWEGASRGRAQGKIRNLAMIAADPDWRARAWILERTYPDEFGRRDRVEVSSSPAAALDMSVLSDGDLAELERMIDLAEG